MYILKLRYESIPKITAEDYKTFIIKQFNDHKKKSQKKVSTLFWTGHVRTPNYTQALCNSVFADSGKKTSLDQVRQACLMILRFFQFRSLLTAAQWQLLKAFGLETEVKQPYAADFIFKHKLGSSAKVKRSLDALLLKEMIYYQNTIIEPYFAVYDTFLMRWFQHSILKYLDLLLKSSFKTNLHRYKFIFIKYRID